MIQSQLRSCQKGENAHKWRTDRLWHLVTLSLKFGVRTNLDGTLTLNQSAFETALQTDATTFDAIFNSTATSDSEFLSVSKSATADITPGTYAWTFNSGTGAATLGGTTLGTSTDSDGNTIYAPTSGDLLGVSVTPSQNVSTANIFIGKSLIDTLSDYIDETIKSAGDISNRRHRSRQKSPTSISTARS